MGTMIDFNAAGQQFQAYRSEPSGPPRGAVLVIHEIWGLVPHIRDVADRFAAAGYLAVAPDLMGLAGLDAVLMAELGAQRADPAAQSEIQPKIRAAMAPLNSPEKAAFIRAGVAAVFEQLQSSPEGAGRTAVVGYCFGGTYAFALAVEEPRLAAAIPFYGHADYSVTELSAITCPVLAFYGADDSALVDALPELATHMKEAGVDFRHTVFNGAGHAFFNDGNPRMYRAQAAQSAWTATLDFLEQQLS
ncbi:dienelactone hydrolase family protein [Arthrobacter sp.]|uniref:dienelactone hydrolase family protein n=1 Tax=Arthrobacter sp. TaxID=1667 RepID=UPI0026E0C8C5|nr:dienelactone hydrolase family protein [Arthrobacter sp.]MDO5753495.1 dienelactone hydrolase family protein [Arthrobacter sp.]